MTENGREQAAVTRPQACMQCGTCCVAPDIASLGKPLGERCSHLAPDNRCRIYDERPAVCRGYRPDFICREIAAPDLESRVSRYLSLFGLDPSSARNTRRERLPSRHSP